MYAPYSDAQKRATAKYNAKAYDRIEVKVAKGKKAPTSAVCTANAGAVLIFAIITLLWHQLLVMPSKPPRPYADFQINLTPAFLVISNAVHTINMPIAVPAAWIMIKSDS